MIVRNLPNDANGDPRRADARTHANAILPAKRRKGPRGARILKTALTVRQFFAKPSVRNLPNVRVSGLKLAQESPTLPSWPQMP